LVEAAHKGDAATHWHQLSAVLPTSQNPQPQPVNRSPPKLLQVVVLLSKIGFNRKDNPIFKAQLDRGMLELPASASTLIPDCDFC
jgi:hypothetical protein